MTPADFPASTKYTQLPGACIAVLPDGIVYRVQGSNRERLYTLDEARQTLVTGQTPDDRICADWGGA